MAEFNSLTESTMAAEQGCAVQPEKIVLRGEITTGGILCPLLLDADGETIALVGIKLEQFTPGTRLDLEGTMISYSPCQQGKAAFRVDKILSINGVTQ